MSEQVTMPKEELESLMKTIKDLSARVGQVESQRADVDENSGKMRMRVTKERKITVMFLDGKPLIGMKNVGTEDHPLRIYEVPNPNDPRKQILQAEIILQDVKTGKTSVEKVNWIEFVQQGERRELTVVKTNEEPWEIEQGVIRRKEVDGYSTVELDIEVPVIVEGSIRTFIVDIDGVAVNIHEDYANIAK